MEKGKAIKTIIILNQKQLEHSSISFARLLQFINAHKN